MTAHNDEDYENTIDNLQKWFAENKNLPKEIGKFLLIRKLKK